MKKGRVGKTKVIFLVVLLGVSVTLLFFTSIHPPTKLPTPAPSPALTPPPVPQGLSGNISIGKEKIFLSGDGKRDGRRGKGGEVGGGVMSKEGAGEENDWMKYFF